MADTTLNAALVAALSEMPNPVKNADNPAFKRDGKALRYADLEATLDACKPILAANGIALMQHPVSNERGVGVKTWLVGHGETLDCGEFVLPLSKQDPQGAGSAITYSRRYSLTALFGLAQEDDDANAASNRATKPVGAATKPVAVPDPLNADYDALISIADFAETKPQVGTFLGDPKNRKEALEAYKKLTPAKRKELDAIAAGTSDE